MKKSLALAALAACLLNGAALAADCVVHVKRTACPGQEAESYKKCDGSAECNKNEDAATTEATCTAAAAHECENKRTEITKSKVVTATFKGAALVGGFAADGKANAKGLNFCAADRADMNKCQ